MLSLDLLCITHTCPPILASSQIVYSRLDEIVCFVSECLFEGGQSPSHLPLISLGSQIVYSKAANLDLNAPIETSLCADSRGLESFIETNGL